MKGWLLCLAMMGALVFLVGHDTAGTDVAKLQPVQTIWMSEQNGQLLLRADTGDAGAGATFSEALASMKKHAAYEIFLETAEYLLLSPGCERYLGELSDYLRPSCMVCFATGEPELSEAAGFLQLHRPGYTLLDHSAGERDIPMLVTAEGRMELVR